jgi:uncharacterized membrane protein YuzA (DUF378 family)
MVKFIKKFLPLSGVLVWLVSLAAKAQFGGDQSYFGRLFNNVGGTNWGTITPFGTNLDLLGVIGVIIQIAFVLAGLIATFYLILGGYNYIILLPVVTRRPLKWPRLS